MAGLRAPAGAQAPDRARGVADAQTTFIQYAVLVPRTIPMTLRIPANLLKRSTTYRLRIVAIDPQGNRSTLLIPFRA